ncbi:MAG: hypothetical protein K0S78_6422 [Thermomicrobiales bacterium]|nr:hypothetical protein [Thermomicrobiales bacterium]
MDLDRQCLATDEWCDLERQIVGLSIQAPEWREVRGEAGGGELKDMLDLAWIMQSMLAKIDQLERQLGRGDVSHELPS